MIVIRVGQDKHGIMFPPTMRRVRQSFFVALKAYDTCHSCVSEHQKTCPSFEGGHNDICECLFMLMH